MRGYKRTRLPSVEISLPSLFGKLRAIEFRVQLAVLDKFFVRASLRDAPGFDDQYLISSSDSGKSMSDDDGGASFKRGLKGFLYRGFGFRVEMCGRFVQYN